MADTPRPPSYDVCVVGAGPVGQTVARELASRGLRVVVLEAGGPVADATQNARGRTTVHGDERYGDLTWKTWRAYGGTAWAWAIDLEDGPGLRLAGVEPAVVARPAGRRAWPLGLDELLALQQRALAGLGLRAGLHDLDVVDHPDVRGLALGRYVFAESGRFTAVADLTGCGVDVITDAEVVALVVEGGEVRSVEHRSAAGVTDRVACRAVVLAAGAVESARLALLLAEQVPAMQGRVALGGGLMDRPRLAGTLSLPGQAPEDFARFSLRRQDGAAVEDRWCTPATQVLAGGLSAGVVLQPRLTAGRLRRLVEQLSRRLLMDLPSRVARRSGAGRHALTMLVRRSYAVRARVHRRLLRTGFDLEWAGWSGRPWRAASTWSVTASVEQLPDPANRVELGTTGPDGVRTARVVWGAPFQREDADAPLATVTEAVSRAGLGELVWSTELTTVSSHHLMGTLSFGVDDGCPATPRGLLRGTANVYAAGAALFPTSGHANPTLGALALGLHVADGIVEDLSRATETPQQRASTPATAPRAG